jgi:hypothetical protein
MKCHIVKVLHAFVNKKTRKQKSTEHEGMMQSTRAFKFKIPAIAGSVRIKTSGYLTQL